MKRLIVPFVLIALATAASAEVIKVVRVDADMESTFSCGDRCKFRGEKVPVAPLRLRIVRGTISSLTAMANDPRYTSTGCIELYSTVVRPRRSRRSGLLDLNFYFNPDWLAANGRNGQFVFVIERDDQPAGAEVERMSPLRLPVGRFGAAYFQAGVDVTILAPLNRVAAHATRAKPPQTGAEPAMMAMIAKDGAVGGGTPVLQPAPHPTPMANCVDVQYDAQPVRLAAIQPRAHIRIARAKPAESGGTGARR